MPYIKETAKAGKTIEVRKYYSARYGKKKSARGENINPTAEQMKRFNEKQAERNLRLKINSNFGQGDIHLVLTYKRELRPEPGEAKKRLERFIREARAAYRRLGREFRYISVTEYKRAAVHHHLVINGIDPRLLQEIWPYGRVRPTYLDDSGQYGDLAAYLIKETAETFKTESGYGKRWNQSKNLKKPEIEKEIIDCASWKKEPRPIKGYYIEKEKTASGVSGITGYEYQFYSMVRIERTQRKKGEGRGGKREKQSVLGM